MLSLYFIRARDLVKIGISDDVPRRLKQLQTGNPNKLELLATIEGVTPSVEKIYHATLRRWHVRGEWFAIKRLHKLIANVSDGARPIDEASIAHYAEMELKCPRQKKTPPEGFGKVMCEVRAARRATLQWRDIAVKGPLYARAVQILDIRESRGYSQHVKS